MDEKLRDQLRIKKVREMKNPIILMNTNDFDNFKKAINVVSKSFKNKKRTLTYMGIDKWGKEVWEYLY